MQNKAFLEYENVKNQPKSKAKQHGGARAGAGRKPSHGHRQFHLRVAAGDASAQDLAKAYLALAIETLASVAGAWRVRGGKGRGGSGDY